jgi:Bifunctional DNA primase/polymerase, N-terminal/Primase C terminal 2 (PriCT-2)
MMKANDRRDAAIEYVRRGWWVFPAPPGLKCGYSKDRHITDGPWGCTRDADIVRRYWNDLPRANIGVPMGAGSGIWDLEIDTREGHANLKQSGAESLAELERQHGKLPPTLMFVSPTGSVHRLFKHPGGDVRIKDPRPKLGIGIDVKADGGMSIAPPSRTRKGTYRWLNRRRVAAAPQWLLDMVIKPAQAPRAVVSVEELPERDIVIMALALLPNDNPNPDWNFWKETGLRIWASTGGTGEDLFHAWSRKHRSYDAEYTHNAWDKEIATCPPDRYGPRAILNMIEEVMPDWQFAVMNSEYDKQIKKFLKLLDNA